MMERVCNISGKKFSVLAGDLEFYNRYGAPPPVLCPDERHRRRLAFRNERNLHYRICDATKRPMVSLYRPEVRTPVYSGEAWWGDSWDGKKYGREIDWNRSFIEQVKELYDVVPLLSLHIVQSENCDFNNYCVESKDCYLSQRVGNSEGVLYSYLAIRCRDCTDCYNVTDCELCSEVVDGERCYGVHWSQDVTGCNESSYLFQCRQCSHCLFCVNLRNAEWHILNRPVSREEYGRVLAQLRSGEEKLVASLRKQFEELRADAVRPVMIGNKNENVLGDYIFESKNVVEGFEVRGGEDVGYCFGHIFGNNCRDCDFTYYCDNSLDSMMITHGNELRWSFGIFNGCHSLEYCINCVNGSHDLFGCVGLKRGEYAILNREYALDEYRSLREKLVEHMQRTGEWGTFFPPSLSHFPYNDTVAHEFYPLSSDEAKARGLRWADDESEGEKGGGSASTMAAASCASCGRGYRFQDPEKTLSAKLERALPIDCPKCRHKRRFKSRNSRKLRHDRCVFCGQDIITAVGSDQSGRVACSDCFAGKV